MPRRPRPAALLLALLTLAACKKGDALTARDSTFVVTMVELRRIPAGTPGDSAARRAVLRRRGVTPEALEAVAAELASEPTRAAAVWRRIEQGTAAQRPPDAPIPPPTPKDSAAAKR
jgi:hypothetical protein